MYVLQCSVFSEDILAQFMVQGDSIILKVRIQTFSSICSYSADFPKNFPISTKKRNSNCRGLTIHKNRCSMSSNRFAKVI